MIYISDKFYYDIQNLEQFLTKNGFEICLFSIAIIHASTAHVSQAFVFSILMDRHSCSLRTQDFSSLLFVFQILVFFLSRSENVYSFKEVPQYDIWEHLQTLDIQMSNLQSLAHCFRGLFQMEQKHPIDSFDCRVRVGPFFRFFACFNKINL